MAPGIQETSVLRGKLESSSKRRMPILLVTLLLLILFSFNAHAKMKTNLYTPEEIQIAKENIKKEIWARQEYDKIIKKADEWLEFSDEYLRYLIPTADTPRAFDVHFNQCPIHSQEIKKYGSYPWIIDLKNPWKVKCPVGGEYYPTNDYDPENPGSPEDVTYEEFIDTGWGWRKPGDPHKYWFVAYFNHWALHGHIVPGAEVLGKAYLLTGDKKYSRKAAVILDRIAEVYPEMDHVKQSRYGTEIQKGTYQGRIVNYIWETGLVTTAARAYDFAYEGLEGDAQLEKSLGKSIEEIKENIETNLLENAARSIYTMDGRIQGNYGMHQSALATIAVVLDNENSEKYIEWVLYNKGGGANPYINQGVVSALNNLLYRDGVAYESAPGYNFIWPGMIREVAEVLMKRGINLYEEYPRMKSMYDAPIDIVMNGIASPNIGDTGSVVSRGKSGWSVENYETAFRRYKDPRYAKVLYALGTYGQDLFKEPIKDEVVEIIKKEGPQIEYRSDNLPGYGLALLRGGASDDPLSVSFYYGKGGGHDHWARLNIEVFGKGTNLIPDLGYPEYASGYHKKRFGWTSHTLSHVTVLVNEKKQSTKEGGRLHHFAWTSGLQYVDASAEVAYKGTVDMYRRALALIDAPDGKNSYLLDIFMVKGGTRHDYSIHGPDAEFSVKGISLTKPQKTGTLAGENVSFGTLYDAPNLEAPGYTGAYSSYQGSGFGYLYNVQRGEPKESWSALWDLKDGKKNGLEIIFIGEDREVVVADGEPPQKGNVPKSLKYILRRRGDGTIKLDSTYITIIQPYTGTPFIKGARFLGQDGTGTGVAVDYGDEIDYLIQDLDGAEVRTFPGGITSQAAFARLTVDNKGQVQAASVIAGTRLELEGFSLQLDEGYSGWVEDIDRDNRKIVVSLETGSAPLPTNGALKGKSLIFSNEYRSSEYEVGEVVDLGDGLYEIELLGSDFLSGYGCYLKGMKLGPYQVVTADRDLFKKEYYQGMYLVNGDKSKEGLIVKGEIDGVSFLIHPKEPIDFKEGEELFIYDFGRGSKFIIEPTASMERNAGDWLVETTSNMKLRFPLERYHIEYAPLQGPWIEAPYSYEDDSYIVDVKELQEGKGRLRIVTSQ